MLRISNAFGLGLPVLVDVHEPRGFKVTPARQAPTLWRGAHGGKALLVAGTEPPDVVELWDWTMHPGEEHRTEAHSVGTRELVHVLDGDLDSYIGEDLHRLRAGDAAAFAGDVAHGDAAPADATAATRFALSVFQPNVGTNPNHPR